MTTRMAAIFLVLAFSTAACSTNAPKPPLRQGTITRPSGPPPSFPGTTPSETATVSTGLKPETKKPRVVSPIPALIEKYKTGLIGAPPEEKPAEAVPADKEKQKVVLNFDKADIAEVTSQIFGEYLKVNYVIDPTLQGRISFYLEGEYTRDELLQLVTKAYGANNTSVVQQKGVYYIQPHQRSSTSSLPIASSLMLKTDKDGVKPVIVIYRLRYMDAKLAMNNIKFLLSPGRPIITDNMTNSLLFVEDSDNARSIVDVLRALDVNVLKEVSMEIVPLQSLAPQDAAQSMDALINKLDIFKQSSLKSNVAFIPMQNFAGVLVLAHDAEVLKTAKQWLMALDIEGAESGEQIHVYFVQNGLAKDIADILNQAFGLQAATTRPQQQVVRSTSTGFGQASTFGGGYGASTTGTTGGTLGTSSFGRSTTGTSTTGGTTTGGTTSTTPTTSGGILGGTSATTGGTTGTAARRTTQGAVRPGGVPAGTAAALGLTGEVIIIPDEVNNAIVVRSNAADYAKIKKTIETLDIVPRAVLIEVMVAEITLNDTLNYGMQWFFKDLQINIGGKEGAGAASLNSGDLAQALVAEAFDFSQIAATGGLSLFWGSLDKNIAALIDLLASKTDVKILSNPTLLATDNKEASIMVGGRQPIPTGSYSGGTSTTTVDSVFSTIQYEQTGLILNVIPHINAGGLVRLELDQTIRNVGPDVQVGVNNTAPTFTERNIKTTLLAHNGSTIVIGGIIQQQHNNSKRGIPGLTDIPILYPLFSSTEKGKDRTEIIIAITPHVVNRKDTVVTTEFLDRLRYLKRSIEQKRY